MIDIDSPDGVEALFRDTPGAVQVVFSGITTYGHFEEVDGEVLGTLRTDVVGTFRHLRAATGKLSGIDKGSPITIDGANYVVQRTIRDGAEISVYVKPA